MFEIWKRAWREAVENFHRELDPDRYAMMANDQARDLLSELARTRRKIERLETEIGVTAEGLAREIDEAERCQKRRTLAEGIEDHETARIAAEFAGRHTERADLLRRKLEVLRAERELLEDEARTMREFLATSMEDSSMDDSSMEAPSMEDPPLTHPAHQPPDRTPE